MKLQITLTILFNSLFFNNVYAVTDDAYACNKAYEKRDFNGALKLAAKALSTSKNDRDALICQGRTLSAQGNLDAALIAFKSADLLSANPNDKTSIALITGHAYKTAKQYDQAILSYQQTSQQAQLTNNIAYDRAANIGIADIHFENNQYLMAIDSYLIASKLDANDNEHAESYENIALTYHLLDQHDLAVEYQLKAFLMNQRAGTLDQYAHSSIQLGHYYALSKNYVSAENTLNKIIKFAKEQGGAYYEAKGSYVLAKVKVATGDIPAAKALIEQAQLIAKNTNDTALAEEIIKETQNLIP